MCGIAGAFDFGGTGRLPESCGRSLTHRGPDGAGSVDVANGRLWHQRLAILDLSAAGHQPMATEDGRFTLVYNGEIYGFRKLRRELEERGVRFRGTSDSEVLLRAWAAHGPSVLRRLDGMFAFALWDAAERRLHLARDRFGIKPLFVFSKGSRFAFGSEIKAVLATGWVGDQLHWQGIAEYLRYGSSLADRTFYEGVREIEPGCHWTADEGGIRVERFASADEAAPFKGTEAEAIEGIRERLRAAVRSHLVSDVPVGVLLSGGIDSSAITAFAARESETPLTAYSARFDFLPEGDEIARARQFADGLGVEHRVLPVTAAKFPEVVEAIVAANDQPFGDPATIPLYLLYSEVSKSGKVVLQGDGGDEVFGGYPRYARLAHLGLFRAASAFAAIGRRLLPGRSAAYRSLRTIRALQERDASRRMALLLSQEETEDSPDAYFRPEIRAELERVNPYQAYEDFAAQMDLTDPVEQMLATDLNVILPHVYFRKTDRISMAHGTEVRVPMVDNELVSFVRGLPRDYKVRGWQKKRLLRASLRGVVPDSILDARKQGFGVPVNDWLRGPLQGYLRERLVSDSSAIARWVRVDRLNEVVDAHCAGRQNRGLLLFKLLMLATWLENSPVRVR